MIKKDFKNIIINGCVFDVNNIVNKLLDSNERNVTPQMQGTYQMPFQYLNPRNPNKIDTDIRGIDYKICSQFRTTLTKMYLKNNKHIDRLDPTIEYSIKEYNSDTLSIEREGIIFSTTHDSLVDFLKERFDIIEIIEELGTDEDEEYTYFTILIAYNSAVKFIADNYSKK